MPKKVSQLDEEVPDPIHSFSDIPTVKDPSQHKQQWQHPSTSLWQHAAENNGEPLAKSRQQDTREDTGEAPARKRRSPAKTASPQRRKQQAVEEIVELPRKSQQLITEEEIEEQLPPGRPSPGKKPWQRIPRWLPWIAMFLLGLLIGGGGVLTYVSLATDNPLLSLPTRPTTSSITVRLNATYIGQIIEKHSTGPNKLSNVQVQIKKGEPLTITGDTQVPVLGTKHVKLVAQPYILACHVQMRVVHADLAGIPATAFITSTEDQVNQQLKIVQSQLPSGFTYCATSVTTETNELVVTYQATPV